MMSTYLSNILIKGIDSLVDALLGILGRLVQLLSRIFPERLGAGICLVDAGFGVFGKLVRFGARVLSAHFSVLLDFLRVTWQLVLHLVLELRCVRYEE